MKYGVNTMVWTTRINETHEALFSCIKEWGFDGVELFLSPQEPADIPAVRQMLEDNHLECTTCSVLPRDCHLVSHEPEMRARGVEFLKTCVDGTAELGARLVCGPMYAGLGVMTGRRRTAEEWKWAVEGLQVVARHAETRQVTICLEPLNRFETYFLNTLEDAASLVHDVGASNVKIHFDTFHSNIEEKHPAEALRSIAKELGHVHISENDRGIPGSGHVDWQGVLKVLKAIRYQGWMTIESFAQPEPDLAAAAAIWRDMAPSGDELAQQGLRFIRRLAGGLGIK
ncbi:MAG: sugar phosphate isomerase/epimerase family protein [Terriglobia bacterium]|jgi:D-psicose/D-tagatose/L-ribulose 3-epimerase